MLTIKTYLADSNISGLGLFTEEFIEEGTVVWKLTPGFDVIWTDNQWNELPIWQRNHFLKHAYYDKEVKLWFYCSDDARFLNHSNISNVKFLDSFTDIAVRNIYPNEELTVDYKLFDYYLEDYAK